MAVKKNYRANNTRLIEGGTGDNPKLMAQGLQDGRDSLYLEYYMGFDVVESKNGTLYKKANRKTERLNLFLWQAPRTSLERNENNETLRLAKQIRFERGQQLLEQGEGYRLKRIATSTSLIGCGLIMKHTPKAISGISRERMMSLLTSSTLLPNIRSMPSGLNPNSSTRK